jgi:F420H(2)-dependent quinone reductase
MTREAESTAGDHHGAARIPPRWFVRTAWVVHRALFRLSGRRFGLRPPAPRRYGMMALHTTGRRTGERRTAIVAYIEDGENIVTMAMNGWGDPPPAWWLNLQANPAASVELPGDRRARPVTARDALGAEHDRLWEAFREVEDDGTDLDALARLRSRPTPLVVLEHRESAPR